MFLLDFTLTAGAIEKNHHSILMYMSNFVYPFGVNFPLSQNPCVGGFFLDKASSATSMSDLVSGVFNLLILLFFFIDFGLLSMIDLVAVIRANSGKVFLAMKQRLHSLKRRYLAEAFCFSIPKFDTQAHRTKASYCGHEIGKPFHWPL